jgi:osmotically-inducible protein OsmY
MSNYNRGQRGQRSQRPYNYNREDSNRSYGNENRDYNYGHEQGTGWGAQQGNDYNENSWYGRSRQGDYGNTGYNTNYGQSRYGNSGDSSRHDDRNYHYEGGSYEGGYGNRGYHDDDDYSSYGRYGQYDRGNRNYGNSDHQYDRGNYGSSGGYGNSNFGSSYGRGYDYNRGQRYDQGSIGSVGNYGTVGSYGNEQYRDRGVWDKTRDEVSSWFGNEDAERRREMDRRFTAEHRGKGPRGYSRSDDRIKEDINDRLSDNPYIDASDVEVSVTNGEVVLSGKVADRHDKRRAEDIAEGVSGVRNVENRIRVQSEVGESTSAFSTTPRSAQTSTEKSKSRNGLVES